MDVLTLAMAKAYADSKGGYTELAEKAVLPETSVSPTEGIYMLDCILEVDKQYTVTLNGEKYKCKSVGEDMGGDGTSDVVLLGNIKLVFGMGYEDGEPWGIAYVPEDFTALAHKDGDIGPITISISEEVETIVPIDQKYLPGVCLPVVELSTTFSVNTYLTDAEGKALDVAFEANTPIIIKCNIDLGTNAVFNNTAAVWSPVIDNNANVFIASFGGVTLTIVNPHGYPAWGCSIMQTEV